MKHALIASHLSGCCLLFLLITAALFSFCQTIQGNLRARHLKDTNARSPSAVSRARVCWSWVQHLLPLRMKACWGDVVQPGACVHIFVLYDYVCAVGVRGGDAFSGAPRGGPERAHGLEHSTLLVGIFRCVAEQQPLECLLLLRHAPSRQPHPLYSGHPGTSWRLIGLLA